MALAAFAALAWRLALPGYHYEFPRDYFEHRDFRTEWWYYTGNVRTAAGKRFGFELVFFRQGERRGASDNRSAWRIDDLYLAHLALTDIDSGRFYYYERLNRAGPGIAGASFAERRVWNGNWSLTWSGERQTLAAVAENIRLNLRLAPVKPLVIHGERGVSRKSGHPGQASHYISFPRLVVEGEINGQQVSGTAWMDHEWFSHQLASDQVGWDWFSAQLDNGTELMVYALRRADGGIDPFSAGTYIDAQGHAQHLRREDFSLQQLAWWTSPDSKARYPIRWRIEVPKPGIKLECAAAIPQQELIGKGERPTYWEGAVTYMGSASGVGYLEMTGYYRPLVKF